MAGFNAGDVFVDKILVQGQSYSFDMTSNFLSSSVVETIFTPGIHAHIEVIDYEDFLGNLNLQGTETVMFSFTKPEGNTASYTFHLNNIKDVEMHGAMKTKVYKLECVSREVLTAQANQIQQQYNKTISDIIKDIINNYLNTDLTLDIESTQGIRNVVLRSQRVAEAIEYLRKEAVSNTNKSSNFMYYLTQKGIHFKTIEEMLRGSDIRTFRQNNTVGNSIFSDFDSNILFWKIEQNMEAMNRVKAGALNIEMQTFNVHSNEYVLKKTKPDASSFKNLGTDIITTSDAFRNLFPAAVRSIMRIVNPNQTYQVGPSFVPDLVQNKMANMAQMAEQVLRMVVIGDPNLEAGRTIFNNVPKISAAVDNVGPDPQMNGRWLIAKVEHLIQRPNVRPRYIANLECLKGSYNE